MVFPTQFSGLPSQWRISDVYYQPDAGVLRAETYTLTTPTARYLPHIGDLGIWTNAPYVQIHPAPRGGTCTPHDPASNNTSEIINGYRVVVKRMTIGGVPEQELCAAHAGGFWLSIIESGPHPPSTWPACSSTTCACSAPTQRTGPAIPSTSSGTKHS